MQPKQCIAIIDSIKSYAKQNPAEAQVYEDWFQAVVNLRDALLQDKRFDAYRIPKAHLLTYLIGFAPGHTIRA